MAIAMRFIAVALLWVLSSGVANAQTPEHDRGDKRIFGIIPNYRTVPTMKDYQPISAGEKFKIARDDSFDRGTFVLAALFGAEGRLMNSTPQFGSGVLAYAKYYSASLSDWIVGDFMTEGIYPSLLRQDPAIFPTSGRQRLVAVRVLSRADRSHPRRQRTDAVQWQIGRAACR